MVEKTAKKTTKVKKSNLVVSEKGKVYVSATFNNTLVTITNDKGETVSWSSAGAVGFKGTRKSTPFAATTAMEQAAKKAAEKGIKNVDVFVKGPGAGRDAALRAIKAAGLSISLIADITPIPHNGPRAEKKRRI
ncbi:MAG: 30S ribosomal protein S11 [Candidatus Levybacteria bacterium CG10_big_fil_rev_8_21_14_0_10_35_13]|nr:MAG: 30S ribosomal protein S11 [Candidatus Levybacteria bacterium CG10_big_fil_rev_8_21_14_0_10_35_13]